MPDVKLNMMMKRGTEPLVARKSMFHLYICGSGNVCEDTSQQIFDLQT